MYYLAEYTDLYIGRNSMEEPNDPEEVRNSTEDIKREREYLCSPSSGAKGKGEYFELRNACLSCYAVHAYGEDSEYITFMRKYQDWQEQRFCNETVPEWNIHALANLNGGEWKVALGVEDGRRPGADRDATLVGEIATKTEVSIYYTSGATAEADQAKQTGSGTALFKSTGDSSAKATVTAAGDAHSSVAAMESTATSAAGAAATTSASGGADELKARGRLAMAFFGAIMML